MATAAPYGRSEVAILSSLTHLAIESGTWAEWFAAIGGFLAFVAAVALIWVEHRGRVEERNARLEEKAARERSEQAVAVARADALRFEVVGEISRSSDGWMRLQLALHNTGPDSFYDVVMDDDPPVSKRELDGWLTENDRFFMVKGEVVPVRVGTLSATVPEVTVVARQDPHLRVYYRDITGAWWWRTGESPPALGDGDFPYPS